MTVPLVDYLIARDGPPPREGLAYDYVLGGDGLYVSAENRYLEVRVPVAPASVRGLPNLYPSVTLRGGRIPQAIWDQVVAIACADTEREVLLVVSLEPSGYQLLRPRQLAGPVSIHYRPPCDVLLQIHSHGCYPASFSRTDDADEQGLGLYGVIGRLDCDQPQVSLRAGAYGYFLPVPWETVFAGDRGVFRDRNFDPPEATEDSHVLSG